MHINQYAAQIYAQNKAVGWWDDPNRCIFQTLQLVSTEIAEATEGERKDLMDDHLPHRKMGEVELADALIRVLDVGGRFDWEYTETRPHAFVSKDSSIGKQHLGLNMALAKLARSVAYWRDRDNLTLVPEFDEVVLRDYSTLVTSLLYCAAINGYDIYGAMDQKLVYNAKRADHKRENRAKAHGKKF